MSNPNPTTLLIIGFILVTLGWVLPMLMVMNIITSTLFLNFLAYGSTFTGVLLGVVGTALYTRLRRK